MECPDAWLYPCAGLTPGMFSQRMEPPPQEISHSFRFRGLPAAPAEQVPGLRAAKRQGQRPRRGPEGEALAAKQRGG